MVKYDRGNSGETRSLDYSSYRSSDGPSKGISTSCGPWSGLVESSDLCESCWDVIGFVGLIEGSKGLYWVWVVHTAVGG